VSGGKLSRERGIDLRFEFACAEVGGGNAQFFRGIGQGRNSVVGGERIHTLARPSVTEEIEEVGKVAIERERHGSHFRRIGTDLMSENVVGERLMASRSVACRRRDSRKPLIAWRIRVRTGWRRRGADHFVEAGIGSVFTFAMRGGAQKVSVIIFPLAVPIFRSTIGGVEILCPLGKSVR